MALRAELMIDSGAGQGLLVGGHRGSRARGHPGIIMRANWHCAEHAGEHYQDCSNFHLLVFQV
jgi:hypothetical protein